VNSTKRRGEIPRESEEMDRRSAMKSVGDLVISGVLALVFVDVLSEINVYVCTYVCMYVCRPI